MASDIGKPTDPLTQDLLEHPRHYSYFQATRLLRLLTRKSRAESLEAFTRLHLRVRPQLSLGMPATDLTAIEDITPPPEAADLDPADAHPPEPEPRYRLTATFLGLYGPSSPLPTSYTEELLDEAAEDLSVTRDFLDILGGGYFADFYRSWAKYRLMDAVISEQAPEALTLLYSLLGLGNEALRRGREETSYRMLRYIGLFSQYPRSAMGLENLMCDHLGAERARVTQGISRMVAIPADQRCRLGVASHVLGDDAYLGEEIRDRMGGFEIRIEEIPADTYHALLPGGERWRQMHWLIGIYTQSPLEFDLWLGPRRDEVRTAQLGGARWSSLGQDTWLEGDWTRQSPIAGFPYQEGGGQAGRP